MCKSSGGGSRDPQRAMYRNVQKDIPIHCSSTVSRIRDTPHPPGKVHPSGLAYVICMRFKKQFLHLYCNSNKKGFLTGNEIEITAMAFNDFSDRGKPDSMISRCTLSGEECFSLLQGQTVVSVFNLQKVHIASGFAGN